MGLPSIIPLIFFGIFSVFNPDGLKSVDLYKGNMPASFGGRAASLIDVSLREGNNQQVRGEGGIGSISSRLTVDGPLFGKKLHIHPQWKKDLCGYFSQAFFR